jgi:hypothetical protein
MHYTAMEGLTVLPFPAASTAAGAPALSTDLLAIIVAVVAFCLSGIFLLFLVPDPARGAVRLVAADKLDPVTLEPATAVPVRRHPQVQAGRAAKGDGAGVPAASFEAHLQRPPEDDESGDAAPEFGRGSSNAPLGGAGTPRRLARHLPVERDGGTHFLAVDDVVAIHANAHYTYIFNGSDKLFCPLAIGDVESRLDQNRFVRIHRSHIVNIERVVGYRRSGDNELVEMDARQNYAVPVSRSRIGWLKSRVATLTGAEPGAALHRRHNLASR